jgi:hypothetical protein
MLVLVSARGGGGGGGGGPPPPPPPPPLSPLHVGACRAPLLRFVGACWPPLLNSFNVHHPSPQPSLLRSFNVRLTPMCYIMLVFIIALLLHFIGVHRASFSL